MKLFCGNSAMGRLSVSAVVISILSLSLTGGAMALDPGEQDFELKLLGKYLFFDKISLPSRQACASCHTPDAGWTNGKSGINLKQVAVTGANPHTVGALKPPSNAYASFVPDLEIDVSNPRIRTGGNFWNGRATGAEVRELNDTLGILSARPEYAQYLGPTADQAHASPFINPDEQGLPDVVAVCEHVESAKYAPLFMEAWNEAIDCDGGVEITFARFAVALAAYQHSTEVNAFDSKRDRALANDDDETPGAFPLKDFTDQENLGHDLFFNVTSTLNPEGKRANCGSFCHRSGVRDGASVDERYTNDGYQNIGTPRNVAIPDDPEPSIGLQATSGLAEHRGLQKIPTLRNVDKRRDEDFKKAYTHNGWFKSLESLVHFYNTRDVKDPCVEPGVTESDAQAQDCWPAPGVAENVARGSFIGDLDLTAEEEAAIVAYLKTLTDIPTAVAPEPFNLKKFEKGLLR